MTRVRLVAVALFAALPLAGCGNKGPLILNPEPQEMPEGMAAPSSIAPPSSATVFPSATSTVLPSAATSIAPPSATTTAPPADTDGTPGTPR